VRVIGGDMQAFLKGPSSQSIKAQKPSSSSSSSGGEKKQRALPWVEK